MATESLLRSTLALYHGGSPASSLSLSPAPPIERVYSSTTTLLANLTNPLNITLLTSHFLAAPAVWGPGPGFVSGQAAAAAPVATDACFRALSIFNTAARHVRRRQLEEAVAARHGLTGLAGSLAGLVNGSNAPGVAAELQRPSCDAWAEAVVHGADSRSPRWRHLLVLVGVLLGMSGQDAVAGDAATTTPAAAMLSRSRRTALQQGVVAAANLALAEAVADSSLSPSSSSSSYAVVLALHYAFPLLPEHVRDTLDTDALLPCAVDVLFGRHGLEGVALLLDNNNSIATTAATALSGPLVTGAGPVAALIAFAVHQAHLPAAVLCALDRLDDYCTGRARRWAACRRLSGVDTSGEQAVAAAEEHDPLWQQLKRVLYAVVIVLQAVVTRSLLDRRLVAEAAAAGVAVVSAFRAGIPQRVLHLLQRLFFISSRHGASHFQAYQFTYLAAIDMLAWQPAAAEAFLAATDAERRQFSASPPAEPLCVTTDLFYLNVAEHFAPVLPAAACERLLVQPALPYVMDTVAVAAAAASPLLVETFEAAHSAVLAVLSCAHNADLVASLSPIYAEALFAAFPGHVSARQFRLAFQTLVRILSPPFPVYATHPDLAETLLEMVRLRAAGGSTWALPSSDGGGDDAGPPVSEQSTMVLTLIDALPFLALPVLAEWMTAAAEAVWLVLDPALRQTAQQRFWEVLASGEMDVERAALGVGWWGNGGGGELVMTGRRRGDRMAEQQLQMELPVMSGAIQGPETKL